MSADYDEMKALERRMLCTGLTKEELRRFYLLRREVYPE